MFDHRALRLCVVVEGDVDVPAGDLVDQVLQHTEVALASGATAVRFSLLGAASAKLVTRGVPLAEQARERSVMFIVEDDPLAAAALGADGVHLSRPGHGLREARRAVGDDAAIGVTVGSVLEALEAVARGADYLEVGPLFAEPGRIGLEELTAICHSVEEPVIVSGGLLPEFVPDAVRAGAVGLVARDEVVEAEDMELACLRLRAAVDRALTLHV